MDAVKAAVLYGNEDIRYDDFPTPEVKEGYIKVKMRATGICGSDLPRVFKNGAHFYPIVLGHEFAGEVVEIGDGVTGFELGDRVSGVPLMPCGKCDDCKRGNFSLCKHYSFIGSHEQGSFAEYLVIPALNTVKFSDKIPFEHAAMFEPSTVALHGLMCNDYKGGGNVAILGCGTIGIFTMQWARIMGAEHIVAFDISDERLDLALRLGADKVVNTLKKGFMEKAKSYTGGRGYDYVFETAGNPITMLMAFEAATNKAHVCYIGTPTKDVVFTPSQMELMNRKEFKLTGSWMSYSAPFPGKEWEFTAQCFADGRIKFVDGVIYKKFPLSKVSEAFGLYKTPGAVKGKIIFVNDTKVVD
jgi:L-iditol 2-dehydrogenase